MNNYITHCLRIILVLYGEVRKKFKKSTVFRRKSIRSVHVKTTFHHYAFSLSHFRLFHDVHSFYPAGDTRQHFIRNGVVNVCECFDR